MKNVKECPLCSSTRKNIFETIEDEGKRVSFHICHRCGLVYQSPRMDEAELEQFYEREYCIERQETEDPIDKDLQMQDARVRAILEMVQHRLPSFVSSKYYGMQLGFHSS
jgi:rubredoxin